MTVTVYEETDQRYRHRPWTVVVKDGTHVGYHRFCEESQARDAARLYEEVAA